MTGSLPLLGRTAVVTGAARGIGRAVAHALAARGARVALLGLEPEELESAAAGVPGPARAWQLDVTDEAALRRTADEVTEQFGPASVVVANAGIASAGPFGESSMATWRRIVEVNLVGSALTARAFLPQLLATRGYYLQVSSLAAIGAAPLMSAYCASKSGVEAFTHSLRAEVAHRGVAVGVAYLSWTDTEMIRDARYDAPLRELRALMPWPASRTYPAEDTAERLVRGIERRAPAVYVQPWLRGVQAVRTLLPGVVAWRARHAMGALERRTAGRRGEYVEDDKTSENTMADSDTPHPPGLLADEIQREVKPGTAVLRLETTPDRQGILDGAWWPRSRDIVAELPSLITELVRHLGPITRVGLDASAWDVLPTRLTIDDRVVHIDSFAVGDDTVLITRGERDHFSLLVVPPQATPDAARAAMAKAVAAGNVQGAEQILIDTGTPPRGP